VTVFRSADLATGQRAVRALNAVGGWLWALALAAFAAAVWLARGARRRVLRALAAGLVVAGVALLAIRALAGRYVVDALAPPELQAVASTAWAVVTARLSDSAWTTIGVGTAGLVALWLEGSARARSVRLALAPLLRSPELAFGLAVVLLALLRWWGPTVETREWRGVALIAATSLAGVEVLRRTTAREFPSASLAAVWSALTASGGREPPPEPDDHVAALERLARLHAEGALDDDEFAAAKRRILDRR
jgi:hypothetical protein